MHRPELRWATEPGYMRLFFLYLLAVACIAAVRTLRLLWVLYPLGKRKEITLQEIRDGYTDTESVARAALANKVGREAFSEGGADQLRSGSNKRITQLFRAADGRFHYLWEMHYRHAATIGRLGWLTLLLSFLLLVYGAFPTWNQEFNNANIPGSLALASTMFLLFKRLSLGIALCLMLYSVSSFFESILTQRITAWKYLRSRFESDFVEK